MSVESIRVMVVDDTTHVRELLTAMLNIDGFTVVADAGGGEAAVAAAETSEPDVVVVDYKMPGVDGIETARRLRAVRPEQRVILYTAFADDDLYAAAASAGATVCLKTDGLSSLEQEIDRLANR
jgi:NarL family two-component system response regulator LiaR